MLLAAGCAHRAMEGSWYGPMPLDGADPCRIRLHDQGRFRFECTGRRQWAGEGRYTSSVDQLTLEYTLLTVDRETVPIASMPVTSFAISGERNQLVLRTEGGETLRWERRTSSP